MGKTFWMRGVGEIHWQAAREGEPFTLGWRLFQLTPQQRVDIVLNGKVIRTLPPSAQTKWFDTGGTLSGAARANENVLQFRPNVINTPDTPIPDAPPNGSLLFKHLKFQALAHKTPPMNELLLALPLAVAALLLLGRLLGFRRGTLV